MTIGKWIFGTAVAGLWLSAAQAGPIPVSKSPAAGAAGPETVQFFYEDAPPPRHRYYPPPPPPAYYEAPARRGYYTPPPPPPGYRSPPVYGYVGKEAMKDYVKNQREAQKEILKDQTRAWNRMNGF